MTTDNIQLGEKLVGEIEGEFYVPSYQRGYRWDETQVCQLLNDIIENGDQAYCLQPLVVRQKAARVFELIDGQQRLTTIHIILRYIKNLLHDDKDAPQFILVYETRKKNEEFFNHLDDEVMAKDNIDFFFMHRAYKLVESWFGQSMEKAKTIKAYLDKNVKVIWYELKSGTREDAVNLFTRLNIGRIPLTNAELVKALFLCRSEQVAYEKQLEIAMQWDIIEQEMHDEDFWFFLTKKSPDNYPTRIELLFDFMAPETDKKGDPYSTFEYFKSKNDLLTLWEGVEGVLHYYYRLKEWYKRDDWYHKVGYLVASGKWTIYQLVKKTKDMKKADADNLLSQLIKESVYSEKPYDELSYEKDYGLISRILLLFNVVSLMTNGSKARFPFKEYNNERWSLEHIHAQHSEKLNKKEQWISWLKENLNSFKDYIEEITDEEKKDEAQRIVNSINKALENDSTLTGELFNQLATELECNMYGKENGYIHSLANMALLQRDANSALNNSTFDIKRRKIIALDKKGYFIPYCTRMVFNKFYTSENRNQISYFSWNDEDRREYVQEMNKTLEPYLKGQINYETKQSK